MGLACINYADDYDGWAIHWYPGHGTDAWPRFLNLKKYITDANVFHCPTEQKFTFSSTGTSAVELACNGISYGLNYSSFGAYGAPGTSLPFLSADRQQAGCIGG